MTYDVMLKNFYEWTKDKNPRGARISIYERIRDIPYAIIPELLDSETGPIKMLKINKGSCQPKHFLLEQMYAELGIPILYARYAFKWNEIEIDYPSKLKELAKKMPITHHLACKATVDDRLVLVDATIDLKLEKLGLPINKEWDGVSDTLLAITKPLDEEIYHPSEKGYFGPPLFTEIESEFYSGLNRWLEEVRSTS